MKHCVSCGGQQPKQAAKSNMLLKLLMIAIAVVALIMAAGCGPSAKDELDQQMKENADALESLNQILLESIEAEKFVGTWTNVDDEGISAIALSFEHGGSGTLTTIVNAIVQTESLKWEVKDGKLYLEDSDENKVIYEYSFTNAGKTLTIGDAVYTKQQ